MSTDPFANVARYLGARALRAAGLDPAAFSPEYLETVAYMMHVKATADAVDPRYVVLSQGGPRRSGVIVEAAEVTPDLRAFLVHLTADRTRWCLTNAPQACVTLFAPGAIIVTAATYAREKEIQDAPLYTLILGTPEELAKLPPPAVGRVHVDVTDQPWEKIKRFFPPTP